MKTASLMMTALLAPSMGALNIVPGDVTTCSVNEDCRTFDSVGDCTTATGLCGSCTGLFTAGANTLNLCNDAGTTDPKITVYYALRSIADGAKAINCDADFTAAYDTKIKEVTDALFTTAAERSTVEIVHLCHKPTTGVHTLHTSIKMEVVISSFLSQAAFTTVATDINTKLAAATGLDAVGKVESALAFRDKSLANYCTQTNGVFVPFFAALTDTDKLCKSVSCDSGYSFDKSVLAPVCVGPGSVATNMIATCGSNSDCTGTGTAACSTDFVCSNCNIQSGGNTLNKCGSTTDSITLHYVLTHGTMTGDATKAVDCTKEATFSAPYETLVKTVDAAASVVSICKNNKLRSVITLTGTVAEVLTANSKYITLATKVNDLLIKSTDADLKAVGAIESVHVGTDESFIHLCPNSRETTLKAPLSYANYKHETNDKECAVVKCLTDYTLTTSNTCSYKLSPLVTSDILTCGVNADCEVADTLCNNNYLCASGAATCNHYVSSGNTLNLCNSATGITDQTTTLYFVLNHQDRLPSRVVDCDNFDSAAYDTLLTGDGVLKGKVTTAELSSMSQYHTCLKSGATSKLTTVIKVEVRISNLLGTTSYRTMAENINYLLATTTVAALKYVGEVATVHAATAEAFSKLCPAAGGESVVIPFSATHFKSLDKETRDCRVITCSDGYRLSSTSCVTTSTDPPTTPVPGTAASAAEVSFDVTGELSEIGKQSDSILATANTALATTDMTCREICPTTGGGACTTCQAAKALSRESSILAAGRYKMWMRGTTSKSQSQSITSLRSALSVLFASLSTLTFHENSLSVTVTIVPYDDGDDSLSGGAIAGIVIGCVVFVVIVVVLVYCFCCKSSSTEDGPNGPDDEEEA
eukprot:TRINITY_DN2787_c2_g2_i1.p1 TRINITY_DN2787_c2_g2~~TRINITY_DN2787_c2_g2_i1.p1  ORF type:complete len:873 (+),score=203.64 TRINITY_DN2787_c2_g2_i1:46-2664(+)